MRKSLVAGSVVCLWAVVAWSQGQDIRAILGYPQTILHNAQVITVSDATFTSNLGSTARAIAIRDGKILATGTNDDMLALAGPQTRKIDLNGRTVVPGFITVHNHPQDWMHVVPQIVQKAVPEDVMIGLYQRGTPQQQIEDFPRKLEEAVLRAKPGVWIYAVFIWDPATGSRRSLSQLGGHENNQADAGYDRAG